MIIFKTIADLAKLPPDDPTHAVIQSILAGFPRDPATHGYIVLIELGDTHISLPELKAPMAEICWDGVWKADGYYHAVRLTNNEFALEFIVPDADWLDADLRENLEAQLSASYVERPPF